MEELIMLSKALGRRVPVRLEIETKNGFISVDYIQKVVLEELGLPANFNMNKRSRKSEYFNARSLSAYFIWELLGGVVYTQEKLARHFNILNSNGIGDHTTIIHYLQSVSNEVLNSAYYRNIYNNIKRRLDYDFYMEEKLEYIKHTRIEVMRPEKYNKDIDIRVKLFLKEKGHTAFEILLLGVNVKNKYNFKRRLDRLVQTGYIKKSPLGNYYV